MGQKNFDRFVLMIWLMYCRAPGRETAPDECVDLGEVGRVKEKDWERLTPIRWHNRDDTPPGLLETWTRDMCGSGCLVRCGTGSLLRPLSGTQDPNAQFLLFLRDG
jgi:hypothetical protein